jgi:ribosomal protein L40E
MDKMPDGAKFYAKIDEVSTQIASARAAIKKLDDAAGTMKTIPSRVNELRTQAQSLFQIGKYQDAEKQASDALSLLTQSQTTTTTSEGGTAELALGLVFLAMPVALIVLVVLYVRSRRKSRQVTPAPAATSTRPKLKYCLQCGKEIPEETTFCRYCGASQTT